METMTNGLSFADAVRSALTESIGSGVDDEGHGDATAASERRAAIRKKRDTSEKLQRKEMRKRICELRRVRHAERVREHTKKQRQSEIAKVSINNNQLATLQQQRQRRRGSSDDDDDDESEGESVGDDGRPKPRRRPPSYHECGSRCRRRRRERDSATRRKRSEWSSTSDSDGLYPDRSRRRLR